MSSTQQGLPFAGLVLAGGESSRMGRDKALLTLPDGRTLLERAVSALREAGAGEIIVATGPGRSYGRPDTIEVADPRPNGGPLAGVVAGFNVTTHDRMLVLAVDLPEITAEFLRNLVAQATRSSGVVPVQDERVEPLVALYPKTARESARLAFQAGRLSLQSWVRELNYDGLVRLLPLVAAQRSLFANWNTPADCR